MRRILLIALLGATVLAVSTSTAAARAKPATFKTGTYKAQATNAQAFKITLKRTRCAGKVQLCLSLPAPQPYDECHTPVTVGGSFQGLTTPVALPRSGKLTAHQTVGGGQPTETNGQMTFSIAFTKKGTATGSLEISLTVAYFQTVLPCTNKATFTAKLG